jgi:hypothetical protein
MVSMKKQKVRGCQGKKVGGSEKRNTADAISNVLTLSLSQLLCPLRGRRKDITSALKIQSHQEKALGFGIKEIPLFPPLINGDERGIFPSSMLSFPKPYTLPGACRAAV